MNWTQGNESLPPRTRKAVAANPPSNPHDFLQSTGDASGSPSSLSSEGRFKAGTTEIDLQDDDISPDISETYREAPADSQGCARPPPIITINLLSPSTGSSFQRSDMLYSNVLDSCAATERRSRASSSLIGLRAVWGIGTCHVFCVLPSLLVHTPRGSGVVRSLQHPTVVNSGQPIELDPTFIEYHLSPHRCKNIHQSLREAHIHPAEPCATHLRNWRINPTSISSHQVLSMLSFDPKDIYVQLCIRLQQSFPECTHPFPVGPGIWIPLENRKHYVHGTWSSTNWDSGVKCAKR